MSHSHFPSQHSHVYDHYTNHPNIPGYNSGAAGHIPRPHTAFGHPHLMSTSQSGQHNVYATPPYPIPTNSSNAPISYAHMPGSEYNSPRPRTSSNAMPLAQAPHIYSHMGHHSTASTHSNPVRGSHPYTHSHTSSYNASTMRSNGVHAPMHGHPQSPIAQSPPSYSQPVEGSSQYPASPQRPFACDQCALSFNRQHDLKRHKETHNGDRPFECNGGCGKTFTRKDALKRHQLVKQCGTSDD